MESHKKEVLQGIGGSNTIVFAFKLHLNIFLMYLYFGSHAYFGTQKKSILYLCFESRDHLNKATSDFLETYLEEGILPFDVKLLKY